MVTIALPQTQGFGFPGPLRGTAVLFAPFLLLSHSPGTSDNVFLLFMQVQTQSHFSLSINIFSMSIYKYFEVISLLLVCSVLLYTYAHFKHPELSQIPVA